MEQVKKNNRIDEIDILKALGIVCMVAGHAGVPFWHFIYLFHMAIFFIAFGFFFKDKGSDDIASVVKAIKSKLKQLWFPFFVWNAIYVLLHNLFIQINVYTDNSELLNWVQGAHIHTTNPYTVIDITKGIIKGA